MIIMKTTSSFFSTINISFLVIIISIITVFYATITRRRQRRRSLPPSPPRLPLVGNLHQLGSFPHRSLRDLAGQHGPLMLLHFGSVPTVVVSSAAVAEEVMRDRDLAFASRPPSSMADRLLYGSGDVAFAPYGESWRHARRLTALHLLTAKRVQSFRAVREEEVALMVDAIRASPEGVVDLSAAMVGVTNAVVSRAALGRKYTGSGERFGELLAEFVALMAAFPMRDFVPWLGWIDRLSGLEGRAEKVASEMDGFLEAVVEERLRARRRRSGDEGKESSSFVDVLLSLDDDESAGMSLSRDSMKAIVLNIFVAGTDTVFTVLEWTMSELIKHPKVLKKAQDEVRHIVRPKATVREEDISEKMTYMKAVIKEALRLHPPGPLLVPRQSMQDSQLLGYEIPAGMRVIVNAWAIGTDPSSWDRPEEFQPERFLNTSIDFRGQDFQFIPFGAGRRGCPGIPFAITTIELALANLLYHFNWEMPNGIKGEELDMSETSGITVHRKSSLILVATPWSN